MSTANCDFGPRYLLQGTKKHGEAARSGSKVLQGISAILRLWYRRATIRPQLAQLDDRKLNDIGLTRAEADYEAAKPFWRG